MRYPDSESTINLEPMLPEQALSFKALGIRFRFIARGLSLEDSSYADSHPATTVCIYI